MSFDGVVTFAAVKELKQNLVSGKIKKIHQPQPEQLLFNIYTHQGNKKLFLSVSGNHSGLYLIGDTPENPVHPPVFCMVLRKHLNGSRITDILQYENDRIIEIHFETVNELGFSVNKKLVVEIMGKHSNAVLVDIDTNKIIDSIKHISIDVNRARQILPGKSYEYPPSQDKIPFTSVSENQLKSLLCGQLQPDRCILSAVQGISPPLASSLAYDGNTASEGISASSVYEKLKQITTDIENNNISPSVYLNEENKPVDFHVIRLSVYEDTYTRMSFDTFSEAAFYYFANKASSNTVKQKSNDMQRIVQASLNKLKLKTQRLNEDLYKAENSEKYRIFGELLTANLHMVKPGSPSVTVTSYYDGSQIDIPLDAKISPAKNAQNYYKKYGKFKTAVKEKKIQLEETKREIDYIESIAEFIERADSIESIDEIKQELIDAGLIRYKKKHSMTQKGSKPRPYKYTLSSGLAVMVGRNNRENDWLTLKKAASSDIWFHTKDIPGSHVILFTLGKEPSENDLFEAASIAAYHSKGRDSENVPVDYTKARYVKKPTGAKPGMVIFTHNKTLYVEPKEKGKTE